MPDIIYTKKARKSIKSLDIRVKEGIEKHDTIIIDAVLPRGEAYKGL